MDDAAETNNACGLRRRSLGQDRAAGRNLPLNLDADSNVKDGGVIRGTPSPCRVKIFTGDDEKPSSSVEQFRKKQQSFEIHIEDCDEEEMSGGSDDEANPPSRPITPANVLQYPDCSGNVTYKEQVPKDDFLRVGERDTECLTDVSEGESENEDENDDGPRLSKDSVIKRVP